MERGNKADGKEGCGTAWMLRFRVPDTEGIFFSMEEEGERFLLEYREGILKAVIRFSARPEPVTLAGICRPGNEAVPDKGGKGRIVYRDTGMETRREECPSWGLYAFLSRRNLSSVLFV